MAITGEYIVDIAKVYIGTPYVYGSKLTDGPLTKSKVYMMTKMYPKVFTTSYLNKINNKNLIGKLCVDCSGLVCFPMNKYWGSSQLYANAYARLPMSKINDFADGTILWKTGHVGIIYHINGKPYCIEAKGIDYGTIEAVISNPNRWTCGLTFKDVDYTINNPVPSNLITYKTKNPYPTPRKIISKGSKGNDVRWLQYELIEAGFGYNFTYDDKKYKAVSIDGDFGRITDAALRYFQRSCKIIVTGELDRDTKYYLEKDSNEEHMVENRCPYTVPNTIVSLGQRGSNVLFVQWQLYHDGYTNIQIDGKFGNATKDTVKKYQKKYNLEVDGVVGSETINKMISDDDK